MSEPSIELFVKFKHNQVRLSWCSEMCIVSGAQNKNMFKITVAAIKITSDS